MEQFDHVKKNLSLQDADELAAQEADPMFSIKAEGLSEDMKRVMSKLNTADATKARPYYYSYYHRVNKRRPEGIGHTPRLSASHRPYCQT